MHDGDKVTTYSVLLSKTVQKHAEIGTFLCPQCHPHSSHSFSFGPTPFLFPSPLWLDLVNLVTTLSGSGAGLKVLNDPLICMVNNFSCAVVWRHDDNPHGYVFYIYTFGFVGPVTVISTSYFRIIRSSLIVDYY